MRNRRQTVVVNVDSGNTFFSFMTLICHSVLYAMKYNLFCGVVGQLA